MPIPSRPVGWRKIAVLDGLAYYADAGRLLGQHRDLWKFVAVPLALNLLLASVVVAVELGCGFGAIAWLTAWLPDDWGVLSAFLDGVVVVLAVVFAGLLVSRVGAVVCAPWYARLARRVEQICLPLRPQPPDPGPLQEVFGALRYELEKAVVLGGVGALALAANVVPVVGQFSDLIIAIATAICVASIDALDPALERHRLGVAGKARLILAHGPAVLGFGGPAALLNAVPILNLLVGPFVVTAATLLYCERLSQAADEVAPARALNQR